MSGHSDDEHVTVILPLDLGAASRYDRDVFPLAYHDGPTSDINKGSVLLSATLEEIVKIREFADNLAQDDEFIYNTRIRYEALQAKKSKLLKKGNKYNPFKKFMNYRSARLFHAASLSLFLETKETSERIQRERRPMQTVPTSTIHAVNDLDSQDSVITGIAINVPGKLNDDAIQKINDVAMTMMAHASESFVHNPIISQLNNEEDDDTEEVDFRSLADTADAESLLSSLDGSIYSTDDDDESSNTSISTFTTRPTSSSSISITINSPVYNHSILTSHSENTGLTINHGEGNSGASVSQHISKINK